MIYYIPTELHLPHPRSRVVPGVRITPLRSLFVVGEGGIASAT